MVRAAPRQTIVWFSYSNRLHNKALTQTTLQTQRMHVGAVRDHRLRVGEVAHALQALPRRRICRFVEPPEWVKTFDDWNTWILIYNYGYPEEFRHLAQRAHEAALVMKHRRKKEQ